MAGILETLKIKEVDEALRVTDKSYVSKRNAGKGRKAIRILDLRIKQLEECRLILVARITKRSTDSQRKSKK